jgi:branched-chain amino acid transport system permease protein
MLEIVAQAVVNGLLIGGIYALVSIGVTLIFGVVKIVNFAQGEFVMIGMYISFFLATYFGVDPLVSLAVSMPVLFVVGVLLQHFLIRRVLGLGDMPQIFLTFALSLLLMNIALMLFTANYRTVHTWYSDEALHLGAIYVPVAKLIAFVLAMALSGILWVFLHTTDMGKAMRAAAQKPEVAMLMGINPNRVFAVATGVALALAGAAGSLLMPFYPASPMVGQVFVLMAFVAVVLGTLGNIKGALIASLMMGVAESLGIQFVGADSGLIVVFLMLLLTLAFRSARGGATRIAFGGDEPVCDRHFHQGAAVCLYRRRLEPDRRLRQAALAGPCRLFRLGRLYFDDPADRFQHLALDRNAGRWRGGHAGKPADRRVVLPAARALFCDRHHRNRASLHAALSQVSRFRLGRRGHDHPQSRQRAADDAVRSESRVLLHCARFAGDRAGDHLPDRTIVDGILPGRHRRG